MIRLGGLGVKDGFDAARRGLLYCRGIHPAFGGTAMLAAGGGIGAESGVTGEGQETMLAAECGTGAERRGA